jgi:very-short-patch-repair endonuclease
VDNDIEIMTGQDSVLVYDRSLDSAVADGLTFADLLDWWSESAACSDEQTAKTSFWKRLLESFPKASPPQRFFFETYHEVFAKDVLRLPALLPEVWLHWDHKTVSQRGKRALPSFRMDFLMLAPEGRRIVFEVDGKHHYSDSEGRASPAQYAKMAQSDRNLKLCGYEVYRFGAHELLDKPTATATVESFFGDLFKQLHIQIS